MTANTASSIPPTLGCQDHQRHRAVRDHTVDGVRNLNGIDYIEADEPTVLRVQLLAPLSEDVELEQANIRIDGGARITGILAVSVDREQTDPVDPLTAGCLIIGINRTGDASTYTLRIVEPGPGGAPGDEPLAGFDVVLNSADFSFAAGLITDLDCAAVAPCPNHRSDGVAIDYLAKDFSSFQRIMYDRLSVILPGWTESHEPDLMVTLVELLAYTGDYLSYYQDAVATEAYLDTARRRISIRRHARLVDYAMHEGCNARAWVFFEVTADASLPAGFALLTSGGNVREPLVLEPTDHPGKFGPYQVFEPVQPVPEGGIPLRLSRNAIQIWTWGDGRCCLPAGATVAALVEAAPDDLGLEPGDVLIFEEVLGPHTGDPADADPTHRHPVRLTRVSAAVDPAFNQRLLEVEWSIEDALPFPLCVSSIGPAPDCPPMPSVSVARGNVILVDNGWTIPTREPLFIPCGLPAEANCGCPNEKAVAAPLPIPYRGHLAQSPLTHHVPFPEPASEARRQRDALAALPGRIDAFVRQLWHAARHGEVLTQNDVAALKTLFGERAVAGAGLTSAANAPSPTAQHQAVAIHRLLLDEGELLRDKKARVRRDLRRVRGGAPLTQQRLWELTAMFGQDLMRSAGLVAGVTLGSAASAIVQDPRAAMPDVALYDVPQGDAAPTWLPCRDLLSSGPNDQNFVAEVDDNGRPCPRFGDGNAGKIPTPASTLWATYRIGIGLAGNVGAETINRLWYQNAAVSGLTIKTIRNPLPATGGVDPEPVDQVCQLAPGADMHDIERAITAADYAEIAMQNPAVQRAAATLEWTGFRYDARVAIDPLGSESPGIALLEEIEQTLLTFRRINHDVRVVPAEYVPLAIRMKVDVAPQVLRAQVRASLLNLFGDRILSNGKRGFFHPDNVSFGDPIAASRLLALAQSVAGVLSVEVTQLARLGGAHHEVPDDGVLRVGSLEIAQLDNDPRYPERGSIQFNIGGGR